MLSRKKYTFNHDSSQASDGRYRRLGDVYFYRLDFRPPAIILRDGFSGSTDGSWMNLIYGTHTVFCSRSPRGVAGFACEALLHRNADGSNSSGRSPLGKAPIYASSDAYVYKFCADGLEYINVMHNIGYHNAVRGAALSRGDVDAHSVMVQSILGQIPAPSDAALKWDYDPLPGDPAELEKLRETDRLDSAKTKAWRYAQSAALYTEEMIVRGPVEPGRIGVYQYLPLVRRYLDR
ncbi:hypothetical protein KNO81_42175 [Paraburkholderia sediminicola]|nr:hypothetical protein [Paraburkholderia sediminicola]